MEELNNQQAFFEIVDKLVTDKVLDEFAKYVEDINRAEEQSNGVNYYHVFIKLKLDTRVYILIDTDSTKFLLLHSRKNRLN